MNVDIGFFEAYHRDRFDLVLGLARQLESRGYRFGVYTASRETYRACQASRIPALHISTSHSLPGNLRRTEFPMRILGTEFGSLDELIHTEASYFFAPSWQYPAFRRRFRQYLARARSWAKSGLLPRYGMTSRAGGELVRLAFMSAAESVDIPWLTFGTFPAQIAERQFMHDDLDLTIDLDAAPVMDASDARRLAEQYAASQNEVIQFASGVAREPALARFLDAVRDFEPMRLVWPLNAASYWGWHESRRTRYIEDLSSDFDVPDGPFVFVPLHTLNDAQLTVRNRRWLDQSEFVAKVAQSVPHDWHVVVKLHPGRMGLVPKPQLARMAAHRNVTFAPTPMRATQIARRARAVVTICSTVGFEAFLDGVPVLVGGNWNMPDAPGVDRFDSHQDLYDLLHTIRRPSVEDRVRFLERFLSRMRPGNVYVNRLDEDGIARAVLGKLGLSDVDEPHRRAP